MDASQVHDPSNIYFTGAKLELFEDDPPSLQKGSIVYPPGYPIPIYTQEIIDMAIARAEALPDAPPAITLALKTRLSCNTGGTTHVWTATPSEGSKGLPDGADEIIAKIYDPAYDGESYLTCPFNQLANTLLTELDIYRQLKQIQGNKIPRCYGLYKAAIFSQGSRIVHVLLFEYVQAADMRTLIGSQRNADLSVCNNHRVALLDGAIRLWLDLVALGVEHLDFQPTNVLVYPPQDSHDFCQEENCPVRYTVNQENVRCVMVDFRLAERGKRDESLQEGVSPGVCTVTEERVEAMIISHSKGRWLGGFMDC